MAQRYYLPAEQVLDLEDVLLAAAEGSPELVADVRRLVFATPIPDEMADEIERSLDENCTSPSPS